MRMPSTDDLNTAIGWLRSNEGDNGEAERCQRVADWIEHEERERAVRYAARQAGVTVAVARRKFAEMHNSFCAALTAARRPREAK